MQGFGALRYCPPQLHKKAAFRQAVSPIHLSWPQFPHRAWESKHGPSFSVSSNLTLTFPRSLPTPSFHTAPPLSISEQQAQPKSHKEVSDYPPESGFLSLLLPLQLPGHFWKQGSAVQGWGSGVQGLCVITAVLILGSGTLAGHTSCVRLLSWLKKELAIEPPQVMVGILGCTHTTGSRLHLARTTPATV
jgi:hypothetical protein